MKGLTVFLDVSSRSRTLDELSARLRRSPATSSHNKGDPCPSPDDPQRKWNETTWRIESNLPQRSTLEEHLDSLIAQFPPQELTASVLPLDDYRVEINVGIFYDTYVVSMTLSRRVLSIVNDYRAIVEVTCYPCEPGTIH
jgi:Domain of unknown function (DUF4279)